MKDGLSIKSRDGWVRVGQRGTERRTGQGCRGEESVCRCKPRARQPQWRQDRRGRWRIMPSMPGEWGLRGMGVVNVHCNTWGPRQNTSNSSSKSNSEGLGRLVARAGQWAGRAAGGWPYLVGSKVYASACGCSLGQCKPSAPRPHGHGRAAICGHCCRAASNGPTTAWLILAPKLNCCQKDANLAKWERLSVAGDTRWPLELGHEGTASCREKAALVRGSRRAAGTSSS